VAHRFQHFGGCIAAGDARRRVGAGRREEIRKTMTEMPNITNSI